MKVLSFFSPTSDIYVYTELGQIYILSRQARNTTKPGVMEPIQSHLAGRTWRCLGIEDALLCLDALKANGFMVELATVEAVKELGKSSPSAG